MAVRVNRNFLCSTVALLLAVVGLANTSDALIPDLSADHQTIASLFDGDTGVVTGDVNRDGRATSADVTDRVLGRRSPAEAGPYGVGFQRFALTKQSGTNPDEDRVLRTTVWYPAPEENRPSLRSGGGVRNAKLEQNADGWPIVLFSHGSCGFPEQSLRITPIIASWGFIVVAPSHPGNSTFELLICSNQENVADSFIQRPEDISFALDHMLDLNEASNSFFFNAIDPERVGVSGHSFGGLTTFRVAAMDSRFVTGLALAPAFGSQISEEVESIDIPIMIMGGSLDATTPFETQARAAFDLLETERHLVEIENTGHSAFNDLCTGGAGCAPENLSQDQAAAATLRYAVPFLVGQLSDDPSLDDFLSPAIVPPGIIYTPDLGF